METYKRRQLILSLLKQSGELEIDSLAGRLSVSPNTIRNDLNALAANGQLQRIRGGAAVLPTNGDYDFLTSPFRHRLTQHYEQKQIIGRWAADLVEDGDAILLDASTTAYCLAQHLENHQRLTVVTNGLETARRLARNPSNTVLLLGGLLRQDGVPVSGLFTEQTLRELNIKTAFVSTAGLTTDGGLTEHDIREAQLKSRMVAAASAVVALVDSSKLDRPGVGVFARLGQIGHIVTDSLIPSDMLVQLRQFPVQITVCDDHGAITFSPSIPAGRHYVIGFANLSEQVPFAVEVRRSLERAAKEAGNVDLIVADNQLAEDTALEVADRLVASKCDLVIEFQLHVRLAAVMMEKYRQANIPVIAVDIPMIGATYFGADNYRAGQMAGIALAKWISVNWGGRIDRLLVLEEPRAGMGPGARMQGQLDGLNSVLGPIPADSILWLDCGNSAWISESSVVAALPGLAGMHNLAVLAFNDDAALGALAAARRLGREDDLVIVGQGADRSVRDELSNPASRIMGSTTYHPERYGEQLVRLALKILRGEPVPPAVHVEHTFIHSGDVFGGETASLPWAEAAIS